MSRKDEDEDIFINLAKCFSAQDLSNFSEFLGFRVSGLGFRV